VLIGLSPINGRSIATLHIGWVLVALVASGGGFGDRWQPDVSGASGDLALPQAVLAIGPFAASQGRK
jgi:hypothetical protein